MSDEIGYYDDAVFKVDDEIYRLWNLVIKAEPLYIKDKTIGGYRVFDEKCIFFDNFEEHFSLLGIFDEIDLTDDGFTLNLFGDMIIYTCDMAKLKRFMVRRKVLDVRTA